MKKLIAKVLGGKSETRRPTSAFRPAVEDLEGRALMSVVGPELHVNSITSLNQDQVATASSPAVGGQTVMVWRHQFNSTGTDTDIHGQRYDQNGNKLGGEFSIAVNTTRESEPSVAVAANGSFVVVWTEDINNSGNTNILAQRFSATGSAIGGRILVATDARREFDPHVAMDAAGNFAVSYTLQFSGNDRDVLVRRYSANGVALAAAQVVANSGLNEFDSSIARSQDGRFVVAYEIDRPSGNTVQGDIQAGRFAANGTFLGTSVIANDPRNESQPDVGIDNAGNAVVAYELAFSGLDHDIKARRVNASTGALGATMSVDSDGDFEFAPAIAVDQHDGDFVVAYQRLRNTGTQLAGPNQQIVREFSSNGTLRNTANLGDRFVADVSINGSDVYFVADTGFNVPGDPGLGVFARRGVIA